MVALREQRINDEMLRKGVDKELLREDLGEIVLVDPTAEIGILVVEISGENRLLEGVGE